MKKILWCGHGGNRYLAEDIYERVLKDIDVKLTIISEWEANGKYSDKINYVKWDYNTFHKHFMDTDIVLCPQNHVQNAKSHIKPITAMAFKKIVLCDGNHPAYKEIIRDGINGFLYNSIEEIPSIINKIDVENKIICDCAYDTVVKRFSKQSMYENFERFVVDDLKINNVPCFTPTIRYSSINKSKMAESLRVAVVYKPLLVKYQSYGDFIYEAFKEIEVKKVDNLFTLADAVAHKDDYDLFVFIEFNPDWYNIDKELASKSIMIGWDTHGHFMYSHLYGFTKIFRKMFIPGQTDVSRLHAMGCYNVEWLPEAHSNRVHVYNKEAIRDKITFVGQVDTHIRLGGLTRQDYLVALYERYGEKEFLAARGFYGREYADIMNASVVCIDLPICNNIGTRIFESCAMGVPVVRARTNAPGLSEFFKDGVNVFEFEPGNLVDMFDKIDFLCAEYSTSNSNKFGERIKELSRSQSYAHRMRYVLEKIL